MYESCLIEDIKPMLLRPGVNSIPIPAFVLDVKIWLGGAVIGNPVEGQ